MRVNTESCIQLRLIDVKISQLAIKVSAREWIGGATFAGVGERPINTNLFISVIALKLGELYTCCPKTNRYCVLKGERLAISCASRPFLRGRFDYS